MGHDECREEACDKREISYVESNSWHLMHVMLLCDTGMHTAPHLPLAKPM